MSSAYIRLSEGHQSEAQISQRDRSYEAAKLLRKHGFACEVREHFTGKCQESSAASIHLKIEK